MIRVAVVEDNEDNLMLVEALLEDDFELALYNAPAPAIVALLNDPPDVVLMDISLPQMDGREVLAALRADPRFGATPVIALTAHAMRGDREQFIAEGFDDYVSKPIVEEQLLFAAIHRVVSGRGED